MPIKDKKLPNGKWLYKIRPYVHFADGTTKQTTIHDSTWVGREGYLEAQKKENQLKSEVFPVGSIYDKKLKKFILPYEEKSKNAYKKTHITLHELKVEYIESIRSKSDPDTLRRKETKLNHFCEIDDTGQVTTYPDMNIKLFNKAIYLKWQAEMRTKTYKKGSEDCLYMIKTLNNINKEVEKMIDYAICEGYCTINFVKQSGKIGTAKEIKMSKLKFKYETINFEEYQELMRVSENDLLYNTFMDLAFSRGTRVGEVRAFRVVDYYQKKKQLMVNHTMSEKNELKEPKTASSKAPIDLDNDLCKKIDELIAQLKKQIGFNDNWYIFGGEKPISRHALDNAKDRYLKLAGIKKHLRLHDFRHSCATWLFSIGVPITVISKILRHKDIAETMETYIHLFDDDYGKALNGIYNFKVNYKQDQIQDQPIYQETILC